MGGERLHVRVDTMGMHQPLGEPPYQTYRGQLQL